MFTIVCYDTPSDRRRRRLAKVACDHVTRVQKSVFEGHLDPPRFQKLMERIAKVIDPAKDRVRVYQLPADALHDVKVLGGPPLEVPAPYYWVGPGAEDEG